MCQHSVTGDISTVYQVVSAYCTSESCYVMIVWPDTRHKYRHKIQFHQHILEKTNGWILETEIELGSIILGQAKLTNPLCIFVHNTRTQTEVALSYISFFHVKPN